MIVATMITILIRQIPTRQFADPFVSDLDRRLLVYLAHLLQGHHVLARNDTTCRIVLLIGGKSIFISGSTPLE